MTQSVVAHSEIADSAAAGSALAAQIASDFQGTEPDAVIVFASPAHHYPKLLAGVGECGPRILVGCSSAGEFAGDKPFHASACAVALRSTELAFAAGVGRGLRGNTAGAAAEIVSAFRGTDGSDYPFRAALVLTDALAGYVEELMGRLTLLTAGQYQFFGGGAGDDARFSSTHVFYGGEAATDAAVALEILSHKPLGIGVRHGWRPATPPMRVTEAREMRVMSLNAVAAVEIFQEHAEQTGQSFNPADPLPFFLHNVVGIDTGSGYKLRVPLAVNPDGSVSFAAEVPAGATVRIMTADSVSTVEAAAQAADAALKQLEGQPPQVALFFDCAATRLRMGSEFGMELNQVSRMLSAAPFVGCNTYGQIARVDGQFSGFHNCTAVVCIIPG